VEDFTQLTDIYSEYESSLEKVRKEAGVFAGAFHSAGDPRDHACNEIFFDKVWKWAETFAETSPEAEQAAQAVEFILLYASQHREQLSYWFAYAAQQHVLPLISALQSDDAAKLLTLFRESYPERDWLPVQQKVVKALSSRAGESTEKKAAMNGLLKVWLPRVVLLLAGLCIAHLGVTLFLLANLGSDPFNVMIQGLFRLVNITSHGTVHATVSLLIVAVLLVVDKSYVRIGTFLCMLLGGPIIDVFTIILKPLINADSAMPLRVLAVVIGCVILAFGMTIVIKSQAGTGPNDLVAVVISDKLRKKFGIVRIIVDICFALTGFLLGGTVGLGTLVCVAVVGPVAQVFMPFSEKLCGRVLIEKIKI